MWHVILNDSSLLLIFIMVGHGLFLVLLIDFWVVFSVRILRIVLLVELLRVLLYYEN